MDETDIFSEGLFQDPPQPLIDYARTGRSTTTVNAGWFATVWTAVHLFGRTPVVARLPALTGGILVLPVLYLLVFRITGASAPALIATSAAAGSIPLILFSQQAYPYGALPLIGCLIMLAHLALLRRMDENRRFLAILCYYTAAVSLALLMHLSLTPLIGASAMLLALRVRRSQVRPALMAAAFVLCVAYLNCKMPAGGFRPYLIEYYPESIRGSIFF